MLYTWKKVTTMVHKNIISLFYYEIVGEISCVRRESGTAKIWYFQRALFLHSDSMRLVQSWLKKFNYLCFFFILGSYLLSKLASLIHIDFSLPQPGDVWPPVGPHSGGMTSSLSVRTDCSGVENFHHYIFFRHPHTFWLLFLPASHPHNSHGISVVFCLH